MAIDVPGVGFKVAKEAAKAAWDSIRLQIARRGAEDAAQIALSNDAQLNEALDVLAHSDPSPLLKAKSWLSDRPQIFSIGAVREWVADPPVREATKRMARAYIAGIEPSPADEQTLVNKYAEHTLNHPRMAYDAIRQLQNFLALSLKAHLTPGDATILTQSRDQTQAIRSDISGLSDKFSHFEAKFDAQQSLHATKACLPPAYADKHLKDDLDRLLRSRHFLGDAFQSELDALVERVTSGELQLASPFLRGIPIRRASRIAASTGDLTRAQALLTLARNVDPSGPIDIETAWLTAAKGDVAAAIDHLWALTDAEHRSALLGLIKHYRGSAGALVWLASSKLTPADLNGPALVIAINLYLEADNWDEAAKWAEECSSVQRREAPMLDVLIGLTSLLQAVPGELRRILLDQNLLPFFDLRIVPFRDDQTSRARLRKAAQHFTNAAREAGALGASGVAESYEDIALWLAFQDPATRNDAEETVAKDMLDDSRVFRRLRFALSYDIPFNRAALEAEIERREKLDATTAETVAADFVLAAHTYRSAPAELAAYIARKRNLLFRHLSKRSIAVIEIEALANSGQVDSAKALLDELRVVIPEPLTIQRLQAVIAEAEGADIVATRRATYEASGRALPDLGPLIDALRQRKDWKQLLPLAIELFRAEGTVDAALLVCRCCRELNDEDALSEFLQSIGTIVDQSEELKSALAWDRFRHGRFSDAKRLVDQLRSARSAADDRNLLINIAIESGDWDSLHVVVEEAWTNRDALEPDELISMARIAFEVSNNRAFAFAQLAVSKAPTDPTIHINAWLLANQCGVLADHPEAAQWFEIAAQHSGEGGPLQATSMRDLAADQPRHRERNEQIAQGIYDASMPLFLAAQRLGVPLTQFVGALRSATPWRPMRASLSQSMPSTVGGSACHSGTSKH